MAILKDGANCDRKFLVAFSATMQPSADAFSFILFDFPNLVRRAVFAMRADRAGWPEDALNVFARCFIG